MVLRPLREPTSLSFTSAEETVVEGAKVFRTLDLFSGYGGNSLGLIGYTDTVAYCESDPHAVAVLKSRMRDGLLPQVEVHRDVTTLSAKELPGDIDLIVGGFPCFTGDTLVFTQNGYVPIQDVGVGDLVLTHKRRWRPVVEKHVTENRRLRRVKGTGFLPTFTTDEHPFLVRQLSRRWNNSLRRFERVFTDPLFLEAREIKGHFVGTTFPQDENTSDNNSLDFWWLVGRCLADGWCVRRKSRSTPGYSRVVLCCGKHEQIEDKIAKVFHFCKVEERTTFKYHITNKEFADFMAQAGIGAHNKFLPNSWLTLPVEKLMALLSGYFSGDGSSFKVKGPSNKKGQRCSTVSKKLVLTLQMAVQKCFGKHARVYEQRMPQTTQIEGRTVNQKTLYLLGFSDRSNESFVEDQFGWGRCTESEGVGSNDTVYNIAVEEDESYLANGYLVHNCQDISCAGKGEGIVEGNRSGLFFQIMRLADEIRPRFIFLENVPAIRTRGLDTVLRELTERGYDCRWTMLSAAQVGAPHKRERWFLLAALRSSLASEPGRVASDCFGVSDGEQEQQGQPLSSDSEGASQFWKNWTVAHPEDCGDRGELRVLSIKNGQITESEESQDLCHEPVYAGKDSSPLADGHNEGLQECGQPGLAELQAKGGSRVDSGPQHTGEAVAHTHGQRIGPNARTVLGEQDERHEAWGHGSICSRPDATNSLAHPHQRGLSQEGPGQSPTGSSGGHETRTGSAKPGLGGVVDGSTSGLDQGLPGYLSRSYWKEEPEGVPRTTQEREQRTSRIKRLGNGVVPLQARVAFEYLMWGDADG